MTIASRVLLVEDSQSMTAGYRGHLESSPHRVSAVASIDGARRALEDSPVDIVLLDVQLPDGSGLDFVDELLAREDAPDIVVMTARRAADLAAEAVRRGAVDFITRPFDATRLLVTLDNTAARQKLRRDCARLSRGQGSGFARFVGDSPIVQTAHIQSGHEPARPPAPADKPVVARDLVEPLWLVEKRAIQAAIAACDGNVNRAAGLLEVAPSTLYRKLQAWKKSGTGR